MLNAASAAADNFFPFFLSYKHMYRTWFGIRSHITSQNPIHSCHVNLSLLHTCKFYTRTTSALYFCVGKIHTTEHTTTTKEEGKNLIKEPRNPNENVKHQRKCNNIYKLNHHDPFAMWLAGCWF